MINRYNNDISLWTSPNPISSANITDPIATILSDCQDLVKAITGPKHR
ncbi:hypothetical protein LINPERPRIM_LOCUS17997 [Linum perenne]